jgi:FtsP/CotA-like multicopper oxidase with cupredoxin domain
MRTTRRDLFSGSAAAALLATIPQAKAASVKMLTATTRSLDVNGKAASVFALLGPDGKPGVTLYPGERFAMTLNNQTDKPTIIHWHGQLPDWKQDGFPWPQTPAIPAGMRKAYDYAPIPGTFWMHSHEGMQEQRLMAAPLIVHDEASILADTQEVVLMLHDFSFKTPEELLAGLTKKDGMTGGNMGSMGGMKMNAGGMGNMDMGSGGMTGGADLNDIDFDAYLANERTLRDPQIFRAAPGQVIRLRIINGASSTNFWIDLGQLSGKIIAVDGHDVAPVSGSHFPIAMAQRLDLLLRLPADGAYPVLAQVEGKKDRTGIILATPGATIGIISEQAAMVAPGVDLSLETRLMAASPLAAERTDSTLPLKLGGNMTSYVWTLNGKAWPNPDVLMVKPGQRVVIDMLNDSTMSHPMHLHGHAFQVVAINDMPISGAVRDTVLVPAMGKVRIALDANNPGRWALHCHNMYHMEAGMMTEVRYPGVI